MVIVDCVRGEFVMAKSIQPAWVGKLRKQLKRAGEKDSDFSRFGADGHKYQLRPPASEKDMTPTQSLRLTPIKGTTIQGKRIAIKEPATIFGVLVIKDNLLLSSSQ